MTLLLNKSFVDRLPFDFQKAVTDHIEALSAHRFTGEAAPMSHQEVEAAIRRVQHPIEDQKPDDFVADYEIIDDTPEVTPADKRIRILHDLRVATEAAQAALMTPAKQRLLGLAVARAYETEESARTPADLNAIDQQRALMRSLNDIEYFSAGQAVRLEDTADDQLDDFKLEPFPAI